MKIIDLPIYLFTWYQVAESLTNRLVTVEDNVTINCDLDIEEIYWYKLKLPDPPVLILRSYRSTSERAKYENNHFKHKYSLKYNSQLFIKNITTEELGVYYCVKTNTPLIFSNGTKLYIDFDHKNQNKTENYCHLPSILTTWRIIAITSILLNAFVIIVVIGLAKRYLNSNRGTKSSNSQDQDYNGVQYAEIDLSLDPCRIRPCLDQTTYSLLQPNNVMGRKKKPT